MPLKIVFMGTPDFSVPALEAIHDAGHHVVCVYSQPPRPAGRGMAERPSPVHARAEALGIVVRTPNSLKDAEQQKLFADLGADAAVVIAYGLILPQAVLDAPRLGCLNVHASLLPRWRGAAPIHRAIMAGDKVTGVQVMRMEAGLDTGPVLLSETVSIAKDDTTGSLHDKLAAVAAQLAPRALAALERGALMETPQDEAGVTYAQKISSEEAQIDWSRPAVEVDRHIRGLSPFPGAWFETAGARVKVLMSAATQGAGAPGEILDADKSLVVACGDGAVELLKLQRAGKKAQSAEEFLRGFPMEKGARL